MPLVHVDEQDCLATTLLTEEEQRLLDAIREYRLANRPVWERSLFGSAQRFCGVRDWVAQQAAQEGLILTGPYRQLNPGPHRALLCFATNDASLWFKAEPAPSREMELTVAIRQRSPNFHPEILATHPEWHGWLTLEAAGAHPQLEDGPRPWELALRSLASIQQAWLSDSGRTQALALGCSDLSPRALQDLVQLLCDRLGHQPEPLLEICHALATGSIEPTLCHAGPTYHNIVTDGDQCAWIDWAVAYVSHPFVTAEHLLARMQKDLGAPAEWAPPLKETYLRCWEPYASREELARLARYTGVFAVLVEAVRSMNVAENRRGENTPKIQNFGRLLSRRLAGLDAAPGR
jgi:hypothetical protein